MIRWFRTETLLGSGNRTVAACDGIPDKMLFHVWVAVVVLRRG